MYYITSETESGDVFFLLNLHREITVAIDFFFPNLIAPK